MANMEDVAKKAGVSQATVSRVINGNPSVNQEIRERVMEWVRKMDYQPNMTARSLVNNKSRLIGVIIPDISNPYFSDVVESIEDEASKNGYNIILCNSSGSTLKEKQHLQSLKSRQAEGILLVPADAEAIHINSLKKSKVPVVMITQNIEGFDSVAVNHVHGGALVARHLLDLGHTSIAFVGSKSDEKFKGFIDTLENNGIKFEEGLLIKDEGWLELNSQKAYKQVKSFLSKRKKNDLKPTAFFAYNDLAAFGTIKAIEDYKYKIPEDIAVIGFDNTSIAGIIRPGLSSVAQPTSSIGHIALEILFKRIYGENVKEKESILLEPRLIIRESTIGVKTGMNLNVVKL